MQDTLYSDDDEDDDEFSIYDSTGRHGRVSRYHAQMATVPSSVLSMHRLVRYYNQ